MLVKRTLVLTIDIGNSQTAIGIYRGSKIEASYRLSTIERTTSDEIFFRISDLIKHFGKKPRDFTHIGLSTVVPQLERPWINALNAYFNKAIQIVSHRNCLDLPIAYPRPASVGPDRLCNMIALRSKGIKNGIVVDMGTATTFDVLYDGGFAGGLIVPGISASMDTLTEKAAMLLPVPIKWTNKFVAKNTGDAMRAGILHGFLGQLDFLTKGITKEMGMEKAPIIATGGWGQLLLKRSPIIKDYDPFLTLEGIRLIAINGNGFSKTEGEE
ncbi:MAG: type III pantothenate kinase [Fibromonadaceae bacterium]|jgi:type III pantothenate kinase|nr:type III pantothenate kinase [Fibromonadaceae bacterium]